MSELWTVIGFDNENGRDAYVVGIYNTKKLAQKKIYSLLKKEFREMDSDEMVEEFLDHDFRFKKIDLEKELVWTDVEKIFKKQVMPNEYSGLSMGYKLSSHVLETK